MTYDFTGNFGLTPSNGDFDLFCLGETFQFTLLECVEELASKSFKIFVFGTDELNPNFGEIVQIANDTFWVINIPLDEQLTLNLGCSQIETITDIECTCLNHQIASPDSNGDRIICMNTPIPALSVTVPAEIVVDWYDAPSNGNILSSETTTFTPSSEGTFYAEARDPQTNCINPIRTAVTLNVTVNNLGISFNTMEVSCETDRQTYNVFFSTDADSINISEGLFSNLSNNNFSVVGINDQNDVIIELFDFNNECTFEALIPSPNCRCDGISLEAPIAENRLVQVCEGENFPTLSTIVGEDQTVDWYDAPENGTILANSTTSFTPSVPGVYYAETRLTNGTEACVSKTRTSISVVLNMSPSNLIIESYKCSADLQSYSAMISLNADQINVTQGTTIKIAPNKFLIENIPNTPLIATGLNSNNCENSFPIEGVNCENNCISDSLILLNLYRETEGANWTNSWNLEQPMTEWFGVTVDEVSKCVTGLNLSNNNLNGIIPNSIGQMVNLTQLNLSSNYINGPIPIEIANLPNLESFDGRLNNFSFEDILPLKDFPFINNLDEMNEINILQSTIEVVEGDDFEIDLLLDEGCFENVYTWFKEDDPEAYNVINGRSVISWFETDIADSGNYFCEITNPLLPNLKLRTKSFSLDVQQVSIFEIKAEGFSGIQGELVCTNIFSTAGQLIDTIDYSLRWNPNVLNFKQIILGDLPNISLENFILKKRVN